MTADLDAVAAGDALPPLVVHVTRADLVRYAGASGDFNPIHWSERFAVGVGLPNVIGHGMLTMALAGRLVTAWVGDPAAVGGGGPRGPPPGGGGGGGPRGPPTRPRNGWSWPTRATR